MAGEKQRRAKRSILAIVSATLFALLVLVAAVALTSPAGAKAARPGGAGSRMVASESPTSTPTTFVPSPPPPTESLPDIVGSASWLTSCETLTIDLHVGLYGAPYYAGASTMRLADGAGDSVLFPVPILGGPNPTYYDYNCTIGPCIPESWLASMPFTLTVDVFNEVPENNELDNTALLDSPPPCTTATPTSTATPVEPEMAILQYVVAAHPSWTCSAIGGTPGHRSLGCYSGAGHTGSGTVDNYGDPGAASTIWQQRHDYAQAHYPSFSERSWGGYPGYHAEGEVPPYNFFTQDEYYVVGPRVMGGVMVDDTWYHYAPDIATAIMNAASALGYLPPPSPTPTGTRVTPTPACCTQLSVEATVECPWPYGTWYGGHVTNDCAYNILGNYVYCLEISPNSTGPWTPLVCQQANDVYFYNSGGTNLYSYYENGIPQGYSWMRTNMTASSANGCWQEQSITTPIPICVQATVIPTLSATPTVTVTATGTPPTPCPINFTDVPPESPFYPYVRCLACRGIISGYPDGTFRPGTNVTRGQIAKIVTLAAGINDDPGAQMYQDVPPGSTFYSWVNSLSRHNGGYIIRGYACGGPGEPCVPPGNLPYFRPGANATRGQVTQIVSYAAGFFDSPCCQMFADVAPDNTFYAVVQRLASRGIIGGYPCGGPGEPCDSQSRPYFRPGTNVTRGQAAKIVASTFFTGCSTP